MRQPPITFPSLLKRQQRAGGICEKSIAKPRRVCSRTPNTNNTTATLIDNLLHDIEHPTRQHRGVYHQFVGFVILARQCVCCVQGIAYRSSSDRLLRYLRVRHQARANTRPSYLQSRIYTKFETLFWMRNAKLKGMLLTAFHPKPQNTPWL